MLRVEAGSYPEGASSWKDFGSPSGLGRRPASVGMCNGPLAAVFGEDGAESTGDRLAVGEYPSPIGAMMDPLRTMSRKRPCAAASSSATQHKKLCCDPLRGDTLTLEWRCWVAVKALRCRLGRQRARWDLEYVDAVDAGEEPESASQLLRSLIVRPRGGERQESLRRAAAVRWSDHEKTDIRRPQAPEHLGGAARAAEPPLELGLHHHSLGNPGAVEIERGWEPERHDDAAGRLGVDELSRTPARHGPGKERGSVELAEDVVERGKHR
jgi:hypothetical protein